MPIWTRLVHPCPHNPNTDPQIQSRRASYLRPSSAAFITTIAESSFQYTQPSHHSLSSADCTTNIAESNFWYTHLHGQRLSVLPAGDAGPRARLRLPAAEEGRDR